jgi:type II secretory pathway pseudopilin PulG
MPPPKRGKHRLAFTLVEVVLAISLILGLVITLLAFYRDAMDVRASVTDEADLLATQRNLMDGLTNELRTALAYPGQNIGMQGSNGQINFLSAVLPGKAVWSAQDPMGPAPAPEQDLQVLIYRLRIDANYDPVMILGLERLCQRNLSALTPGAGQQVRLVSPRIQFLNFRYFDGTTWQDSWQPGQAPSSTDANAAPAGPLPMGVEIILGTDPIPDEMDLEQYLLNYPTFRREVFVPAGAGPLSGTVVQGGGMGNGLGGASP